MDRNVPGQNLVNGIGLSLSARRAWIEIVLLVNGGGLLSVALRKESVDRNGVHYDNYNLHCVVALRKESVDRNCYIIKL